MNTYMNCVALRTFSLFCPGMPDELPVDVYPADAGNKPSDAAEPERFYHGFVLGLMVDLTGKSRLYSISRPLFTARSRDIARASASLFI